MITSLFNGFIDSYQEHSRQFWGQVFLSPHQDTSDYDGLARHLESFDSIATARTKIQTAGLLYLGRGDVRGVGLVGIDLARQCRNQRFRKGLLLQGAGNIQPSFALGPEEKKRARQWMEKKLRRQVSDDELPIGVIVGIGVIAKPDELTDEYDKQAVIQKLRQHNEPMIVTTGRFSEDDRDRKAEKKKTLCWPIDVIQIGHHMIDSGIVYLPFDIVKDLNGTARAEIEILGSEGYQTQDVLPDVRQGWVEFARDRLNLPEEKITRVSIMETMEMEHIQLITGEVRKQLAVMQVMLGLICLVVALLVFVILLMIVMQKKKDIGVIRAVGTTRMGVAGIFLCFGGGIGMVGSALGLALGVWATRNINFIEDCLTKILGFKIWKSSVYMFSQIPDQVDWSATAWIIIVGIAIAVLGAVLPAWRAARLQPVEALRYE